MNASGSCVQCWWLSFGSLKPDRSPCRHNSKETKLWSSNQDSAGKNTRVILVPRCTCKCIPTTISGVLDISKVPGFHLLTDEVSVGSQKLLQGLVFQSTFLILTYCNTMKWPYIKRTQTRKLWNTQFSETYLDQYLRSFFQFCWMWIFPLIKLSWHSQFIPTISLWRVTFP